MAFKDEVYPRHFPHIDFIIKTKTVAFFGEQGTGKSWVCAGVIERLLSPTFQGLVVVPLANIETTWVEILSKVEITICREWEEFKKAPFPKLFLVHYEMLRKLDGKICRRSWTFTALDESQKIKDRNSIQSRVAGRIHKSEYRVAFTGTPFDDVLKKPHELWAQFRFCAPSVFGPRWGDFDHGYLVPTGYMGKQRRFRKTRLERCLRKIAPHTVRVTQAEALPELAPPIYHWVPVTLRGKQRRTYETLDAQEYIKLHDGEVTADLRIVKDNKLHQICGGFLFDDEENTHYVGKAKLRKLQALLKKLDLPVVIFCRYLSEIDAIEKMLSGNRVATVTGKTRDTRSKVNRMFQAGELDYLIAQVRTGGVGVDLFRSCHAVFYSTTFSYIDFDQALKRVQRGGQEKQVHIWMLYVRDTIDKVTYDAALLKQDVNESLLNRFRRNSKRKSHRLPRKKAPHTAGAF